MKKYFLAVVGAVLFATSTQAATLVENKQALGANDSINWANIAANTIRLGNQISGTSTAGMNFTVSMPSGGLVRLNQSTEFPGPYGGYPMGDPLLFSGLDSPSTMAIAFENPVYGFGTQIQSKPEKTFDYTTVVEAFDSEDKSLGVFQLPGVTKRGIDAGVMFMGMVDVQRPMKRLVFQTLENGVNVPFAINGISLKTKIPEPSFIFGFFLLALGGFIVKPNQKRRF